ncbi:MAG: caspase family protein [Microcoleaceae cyanobacterium]
MHFKRRHFLQFTGSALTALGIHYFDLKQKGDRFAKVLAQPTSRKLALLVGINQYPNSDRYLNLNGPVTDVALQKELLIHRFGFNRNDILTLTDKTEQKPTRANILEAFETHLIQQAKPGDVVVFHFSGHGSRVLDPQPINNNDLNSTFVPNDANNDKEFVPDIMGRSLFLLMSALSTQNVTVLLDCCYSGGGTRGNIRVRSVRGGSKFKPHQTELDYQQKWLNKLSFNPDKFQKIRSIGVAKGVVIASAKRYQESADMEFEGFNAGAFTYLLTQYLWQETQSANNTIITLTPSVKYLARQTPLIDLSVQRSRGAEPMFFLNQPGLAAEGIILEKRGNQATVWLGGVERENLQEGIKLTFDVIRSDGNKMGSAQVLSREGLTRTAVIQGTIEPGMLLRETARTIPRDLKLRIGLDPSLGNDKTRAQQLLQSLQRVQAVPFQSRDRLYDSPVDYILSRMTDEYQQQLSSPRFPEVGSIGLLSQDISEVIPDSFSQQGEILEAAINRLNTKFQSLLTARILKQTLNAKSSQLNVTASLVLPEKGNEILAETFTVRGSNNQPQTTKQRPVPILPVNQPFQVKVKNQDQEPLYITVLSVDFGGAVVVLFPPGPIPEAETQVSPQKTLVVPDPDKDRYQATTDEPGFAEILILASRQPMKQSLKALQTLAEEQRLNQRQPIGVTDEAIADLLDDLSYERSEGSTPSKERTILMSEIAAFSITLEVG